MLRRMTTEGRMSLGFQRLPTATLRIVKWLSIVSRSCHRCILRLVLPAAYAAQECKPFRCRTRVECHWLVCHAVPAVTRASTTCAASSCACAASVA